MIALVAGLSIAAVVLQPRRIHACAASLGSATPALAIVGAALEGWGLRLGGAYGHALVVLGLGALMAALWRIRHWSGGWLLFVGLAANALPMMVYGRMPLLADVAATLGLSQAVGTVLHGSKDVVMDGALAAWLGDRWMWQWPGSRQVSVWSNGDLVLLLGLVRTLTGPLPAPPSVGPVAAPRYIRRTTPSRMFRRPSA